MRYKVFGYGILLMLIPLMTPVSSYQEELETIEDTESPPVEKVIRIVGTEKSVSPNSIIARTFDVVTFVNLDGTNGGTTHTVVSVKAGTTVPEGTFNSGLIITGENFKTTITEPGIYEYFDPTHPNIRGTIHVV